MALWLTQSFPRIEELVAFLNARNMTSEQFKVVAGQDPRGARVFFLLYTDDASPSPRGERRAAAGLVSRSAEPDPVGAGTAVEQAEAIIQEHEQEQKPETED